jgi:hypothetical protein
LAWWRSFFAEWTVLIGDWSVPKWVSWVALVVALNVDRVLSWSNTLDIEQAALRLTMDQFTDTTDRRQR